MLDNRYKGNNIKLKISEKKLFEGVLAVLTILLVFNNFFIPMDKVVLPIYLFFLILTNRWIVNRNILFLFSVCLIYLSFIFVLNLQNNNILIFYPIFFVFSALVASRNKFINIEMIKAALLINILFGLFFVIIYYMGVNNPYVQNLAEKGLPFVYIPCGFSPTIQVYGTFCILWLIISFETHDKRIWLNILVFLALFITLNRVSLLFFLIIIFFYKRRIFNYCFFAGSIVSVVFYKELLAPFFNTSTLNSRMELRKGAELSYWNVDNPIILLFGKANHQTSELIAQKTIWGRVYIENGLDFIFHSYGIIGFMIYVSLLIGFLIYLIKKKEYRFAVISLYYFTFLQFMTNEFLSSSIFFFLITIFIFINKNSNRSLYKI